MIPLRSDKDLEIMRVAGKILAGIVRKLQNQVQPGISTADLDIIAEDLFHKEKVIAAFKGYKGFPASICASVNEEVVHGIPGPRILLEGDIISIDAGVNYQGYFSDMAVTVGVGKIETKAKKLIEVSRNSFFEGIKECKENKHISDISYAIQNYVEKNGFSVVRQFVGHGIGTSLHEEPEIPNFGRQGHGQIIKPGMVFAIEPMVNMGGWECEMQENDWTAVTKDGKLSAHFEHTVAVTKKGPEILTRLD